MTSAEASAAAATGAAASAGAHQSGENTSWRKDLISQLRDRNRTQTQCFYELIALRESLAIGVYLLGPGGLLSLGLVARRRKWVVVNGFLFVFADNRLFDNTNTLRAENLQLSIEKEKLRCEASSGVPGSSANAALEAKLLAQADELTMLHRRRGEHTQQIVDLNNKLQEVMKELQSKEARYSFCS